MLDNSIRKISDASSKLNRKARNILERVQYPAEWTEATREVPSNALLSGTHDRYELLHRKIEQKQQIAKFEASWKKLEKCLTSLTEDIKTQSSYERQIVNARINELVQDAKLKDLSTQDSPGLKILIAQSKRMTYRMLQCSVSALDTSKRKAINAKLAQYEHMENTLGFDKSPASPSESNTQTKYSVRNFEMPSFSHLTLHDLETFAKASRTDTNDKSSVTINDIKQAGREIKRNIKIILQHREIEQGIPALEIASHIKQQLELPSATDHPDTEQPTLQRVIDKAKDSLHNSITKVNEINNDTAFSNLMDTIQERQLQKGNQLVETPQWAGFTKPFERAYRQPTGVGTPLDNLARWVTKPRENHQWINRLEPLVRTRARTAALLATLPVTVTSALGLGVGAAGIIGGTSPLWGTGLAIYRNRQFIKDGALAGYEREKQRWVKAREWYNANKTKLAKWHEKTQQNTSELIKDMGSQAEPNGHQDINEVTSKSKDKKILNSYISRCRLPWNQAKIAEFFSQTIAGIRKKLRFVLDIIGKRLFKKNSEIMDVSNIGTRDHIQNDDSVPPLYGVGRDLDASQNNSASEHSIDNNPTLSSDKPKTILGIIQEDIEIEVLDSKLDTLQQIKLQGNGEAVQENLENLVKSSIEQDISGKSVFELISIGKKVFEEQRKRPEYHEDKEGPLKNEDVNISKNLHQSSFDQYSYEALKIVTENIYKKLQNETVDDQSKQIFVERIQNRLASLDLETLKKYQEDLSPFDEPNSTPNNSSKQSILHALAFNNNVDTISKNRDHFQSEVIEVVKDQINEELKKRTDAASGTKDILNFTTESSSIKQLLEAFQQKKSRQDQPFTDFKPYDCCPMCSYNEVKKLIHNKRSEDYKEYSKSDLESVKELAWQDMIKGFTTHLLGKENVAKEDIIEIRDKISNEIDRRKAAKSSEKVLHEIDDFNQHIQQNSDTIGILKQLDFSKYSCEVLLVYSEVVEQVAKNWKIEPHDD